MPAEDLLASIALDALCSGVPVDDHALGIEHVDGIVGDAFDEQSEPPFCFFKPCET